MAFRIDELTFGDSSIKEQERTRKVFLSLVKSANAGEKLTEHEKEFLYTGLSLSQADDELYADYLQAKKITGNSDEFKKQNAFRQFPDIYLFLTFGNRVYE